MRNGGGAEGGRTGGIRERYPMRPGGAMKIVALYGNPKRDGFVHGCLDLVAGELERAGAEVTAVRLADKRIAECTGCFACLREGACIHDDDMGGIIALLREADGIVTGASVRNGYFPALYKRFLERITYLVGFRRDLKGKPVLAIGAVGMAGGKKHLGRVLTLRDFHALPAGYLFFRTGMPGRLKAEDAGGALRLAATRFLRTVETRPRPGILRRAGWALDDAVIRRFIFRKDPDGGYAHVVRVWRERGLM